MSFESSVLPYAHAVLPQEVMECYAFERDHGAGNVDAVTPECREAWIIFHCIQTYYFGEYPGWDLNSIAAPEGRQPPERNLYEVLARWHMAILALLKAKSSNSDEKTLMEQLARREIQIIHDELNELAHSLPR